MTTPSIPSPATWSSGPVTTKALRADVSNGVSYLSGRPLFIGYNIGGGIIPANGVISVPLDTEAVDNWGGHSPAVDNTVYLCQSPGWYWTVSVIVLAYTTTTAALFASEIATTFAGAGSSLIGDQRAGGNGFQPSLLAFDLCPLATTGSDYVRAVARNPSSAAVGLFATSPNLSYLSARWVAALSGTTGLPVPSNPAWPVPPGYVTSSFLNGNIRDTLRFLTYPPLFRGYLATSSGPSLPSAAPLTPTVVTLDTTTGSGSGGPATDNYSGWHSGSNSWQAPVAGVYTIGGQAGVSAGGGTFAVGFSVNGTVTWVKSIGDPIISGQPACIAGIRRVRLNAGDTVQLVASQSSGATVNLIGSGTGGSFCKMVIFWESA